MFHEIKFTLLYFFFMIRHHFIVSIMIFFVFSNSNLNMAYFLRIETMYDDPPYTYLPPAW